MGYIHCCSGLRKTKTYHIKSQEGYINSIVDVLAECPKCGHKVVQLTRIDLDGNVSSIRKINQKAMKFFEKIKKFILFEENPNYKKNISGGTFYLRYSEYGVIKKCYSNLSSMKLGLFEND